MNKETESIIEKQALLNSIVSNCEIVDTENHNLTTLCKLKIDMLRSKIAECKTEEELNNIAFQIISFVNDFLTFNC